MLARTVLLSALLLALAGRGAPEGEALLLLLFEEGERAGAGPPSGEGEVDDEGDGPLAGPPAATVLGEGAAWTALDLPLAAAPPTTVEEADVENANDSELPRGRGGMRSV